MPFPPFVFIAAFIVLAVVLVYINHRNEKLRREALATWARGSGLRFRPTRDHGFEDRFPVFSCYRTGSRRYAENIASGARGGRQMWAFDYHYETYSTDSKGRRQTHHHRFSSVIIDTGLPLKPFSLRPEGFFDKITEFFGADDIDYELGEFSRAFYVKAPDKRWAFDVMPQRTMEFLLESPRFMIEMGGPWLLVRRTSRFKPFEFSQALDLAEGILERLPKSVLRELQGEYA